MASAGLEQLGQLAPLVGNNSLLELLLAQLSWKERHGLTPVCRGLCQAVRAGHVNLRFTGEEGEIAAAMPLSRAFTGAAFVKYHVTSSPRTYGAMAALLGYAADTWPSVTDLLLECETRCLELNDNTAAMVGPLHALARMPHLTNLSLILPRLEGVEMEALAALTGLRRLLLCNSHNRQAAAVSTVAPLCMPPLVDLSPLVHLRELCLEHITLDSAYKVPLPPTLTAVNIIPQTTMPMWVPSLEACQHLGELHIHFVSSHAPGTWSLLALMALRLLHLTALQLHAPETSLRQLFAGAASEPYEAGNGEPPVPCFPRLQHLHCDGGMLLVVSVEAHWRLLAACPALQQVWTVVAKVAPPDLGQLQLRHCTVGLVRTCTQAGALLRHCPLLVSVDVWEEGLQRMPQTLPLTTGRLQHLVAAQLAFNSGLPKLAEACAAQLTSIRSLQLLMPLSWDGALPDVSCCCQLTQLKWSVLPARTPAAGVGGAAAVVQAPELEDLVWSLRGCKELVELWLRGWTSFNARLVLFLAKTLPKLRWLSLEGCGPLPANSSAPPEERLQRIRALLRPGLTLEVV